MPIDTVEKMQQYIKARQQALLKRPSPKPNLETMYVFKECLKAYVNSTEFIAQKRLEADMLAATLGMFGNLG